MAWKTDAVDVPDVRYARAGGVAVAYQVVGKGPTTLVYAPHLTNLWSLWSGEYYTRFLRRLAEEVRLIVFNPRGTGLSDRPRNVTLEARMDDLTAILDTVGIDRATIFGVAESANVCALFAATYPERCERLALWSPYARSVSSDAYPYGVSEEDWLASVRDVRERWGDRDLLAEWAAVLDPGLVEEEDRFEHFVWMHRLAVSPAAAADFRRMQMDTDITDVLGSIRVPTLVFFRTRVREAAMYVAGRIHGAETVELGGSALGPYSDDAATALLDFVRGEAQRVVPESVLATVLFTDLVGSTELAASLGDRAWRDLLERHHADVRRELVLYRGEEVDSAGDGFFCRFDGPARAMACARAIIDGAKALDLEVRAGIHTGECERVGEKIAGIAVVTGSRISSLAAPGEVLVSSTVKDLVAGSGFSFDERGEHDLKGVPGTWRLYTVT
jgi:class 3 adenylate cyclase